MLLHRHRIHSPKPPGRCLEGALSLLGVFCMMVKTPQQVCPAQPLAGGHGTVVHAMSRTAVSPEEHVRAPRRALTSQDTAPWVSKQFGVECGGWGRPPLPPFSQTNVRNASSTLHAALAEVLGRALQAVSDTKLNAGNTPCVLQCSIAVYVRRVRRLLASNGPASTALLRCRPSTWQWRRWTR